MATGTTLPPTRSTALVSHVSRLVDVRVKRSAIASSGNNDQQKTWQQETLENFISSDLGGELVLTM